MATGSGSNNVDKGKQVANESNVKSPDDRNEVYNCSICQETLVNKGEDRTHVTLRCDHDFHLDCIGSAFNAKKTMQCPNCRTIEPGQWHIPIDRPTPTPVFNHVGWTPGELVIPLGFGMELCPFGGSGHLNPSRGPILCHYFDSSLTIPQYLALSSVAVLPNLNSHLAIGSGIVHNPHGLLVDYRTNPFWLTQLSSVPTNPRFYNSFNDDLVVPPNLGGIAEVEALLVPPNLGGIPTVHVDGLVAPPNLGGISAVDAAVVPPYLGRMSAVISTNQDNSSIATVSVAPFGQISSSLANAHTIRPYSGGNSAANVPVVPPFQHGSDGDNDRGSQSGGIQEERDCGPS